MLSTHDNSTISKVLDISLKDYYDLIDSSQNLLVGPNDGMVEWAFKTPSWTSVDISEEGLPKGSK